jgi:ATPase subunit of ABC transporter with duplicated ATPase domains
MAQIIYTLKGLSKTYPPNKTTLDNIYLSFFEGAKIGIIGPNGAGKSTLLKIMAGIDKEFQGEAFLGEGKTVGYLPQEPHLDPTKTVKENVMEGVAETANLLKEFEAISAKFAEEMSPEEMEKLLARQAELQDKIEAAGAWELDHTLEIAIRRFSPPERCSTELSPGGHRKASIAISKV